MLNISRCTFHNGCSVASIIKHISKNGAQRGGGLENIKYEVSLAALCFTPTLVHISSTRGAKDSLDVIHMRESVWLQASVFL